MIIESRMASVVDARLMMMRRSVVNHHSTARMIDLENFVIESNSLADYRWLSRIVLANLCPQDLDTIARMIDFFFFFNLSRRGSISPNLLYILDFVSLSFLFL